VEKMASNAPGLPPFVSVNQEQALDVCYQKTEGGLFPGGQRLLSRKEQLASAAWAPDADLLPATIDDLEQGLALDTDPATNNGYCNTAEGDGLNFGGETWEDPVDYDLLTGQDLTLIPCWPGCWWSLFSYVSAVRTGSHATQNCVSRYGLQDMVGNVDEWLGDQMGNCGQESELVICEGITSSLDAFYDDWNGVEISGLAHSVDSSKEWELNESARILVPLGLPVPLTGDWQGPVPGWDDEAMVNGTGAGEFDYANLHSNNYILDNKSFQVDNNNAEFVPSGSNWNLVTTSGDPEDIGDSYLWAAAETGPAMATWDFAPKISTNGYYIVQVWWPTNAAWATNVSYTVSHSDGANPTTTLEFADQSVNGGQWNTLGTYFFESNHPRNVVFWYQTNGGEPVSADAVRMIPVTTRGAVNGGGSNFMYPKREGRFALQVNLATTDYSHELGFRCAVEAD
jgi:hypothetical protein